MYFNVNLNSNSNSQNSQNSFATIYSSSSNNTHFLVINLITLTFLLFIHPHLVKLTFFYI